MNGNKKTTFSLKNKRKTYFLIFQFYKSELANTFMFYKKLPFSFDNNVLELF